MFDDDDDDDDASGMPNTPAIGNHVKWPAAAITAMVDCKTPMALL